MRRRGAAPMGTAPTPSTSPAAATRAFDVLTIPPDRRPGVHVCAWVVMTGREVGELLGELGRRSR
jgi:hypothetical protein